MIALLAAAALAAPALDRWSTQYTLDAEGAAEVHAVLQLGSEFTEIVELPLVGTEPAAGLVAKVKREAVAAEVVPFGEGWRLRLNTAALRPHAEVALSWRQGELLGTRTPGDRGAMPAELVWTNTSDFTVNDVQIEVVTPEGRGVDRVLSTVPAVDPKAASLSWSLRHDGVARRGAVQMRCEGVAPGERCGVSWSCRPWERSRWPWLLGALAVGAWLVAFRGLVRGKGV